MQRWLVILLFFSPPLAYAERVAAAEPTIDFNRDIRPILSNRCFRCHGPDAAVRKADLRLDQPSELLGGEHPVIVPGDSSASLLLQRITHEDPDERMPPPETDDRSGHRRGGQVADAGDSWML